MAEEQSKTEGKGPREAKLWLDRIDTRIQDEDKWRTRGKDVITRFRDERDSRNRNDSISKINILWSNTEVLRSALYAKTANPDVRRRFPDAAGGDPLSRTAAEAIERSLSYCNDTYDVDAPIEDALLDVLLPGRGTTWVVYEPEIIGEGEDATVGEQKLFDEYCYWKDFVHGKARTWQRVPWVARRHALSLGEFRKKFPKAKEEPDLSFHLLDNDERKASDSDDEGMVEVWEIWDKGTRDRIYIARGFKNELQRDEDPLGIPDFFPCPRPMYSVKTTDSLIPEPEFTLYQDQADELDRVAGRIKVLLEALRWKGIYDGSIDGENVLAQLAGASDNKFFAYPNWNMLKEKGGIENAVGFWPLDRIVIVLEQLYPRVEMLIQEIYEITGISDIVRGATDPNETLGAQKLKSQFGSMRMQKRQREVQRFIRDIYRIKSAIIAGHFTKETIEAITNIQLPTAEEQAKAKALLAQQEQMKKPGMGHNGGPPLETPLPPPGALPPSPPAPVGGPAMGGAMATPLPGMNGVRPPPGLNGGAPPAPQAGPPAATMPMAAPPPMPTPQIPPGMMQPVPGGGAAPEPPPPEEPDPVLVNAATSPTWEDLIDLLRNDKLMAYRIDIETDSTIFVDAEAEKQSRIEFVTAATELIKGAMEMITAAPSTIPLVKELFMFSIRTFKAGRAMEEAFEDAFDQLAANPPEPPEEPATGPDPEIEKAKIEAQVQDSMRKHGIEEKKTVAELTHKKDSLAADSADKKAKNEVEQSRVGLEAAKLDLEKERIDLERQKVELEQQKIQLESKKLDQEASFRAQEIDNKSTIEHRKIDEDTAIKSRQLDDAKSLGVRDIGLRAAAQNKQLVDEKAAASEEGAAEEAPDDLLGVSTLQKSIEMMAQSLSEAQQMQTEVMAEGFKQQASVLEDLIKQNAMPKEVVRGPDNRITGIRPVNGGGA